MRRYHSTVRRRYGGIRMPSIDQAPRWGTARQCTSIVSSRSSGPEPALSPCPVVCGGEIVAHLLAARCSRLRDREGDHRGARRLAPRHPGDPGPGHDPPPQPVPGQPNRTGPPGHQGRYPPMRGFGSFAGAARFCSAHDGLREHPQPRQRQGKTHPLAEQRRIWPGGTPRTDGTGHTFPPSVWRSSICSTSAPASTSTPIATKTTGSETSAIRPTTRPMTPM